jgi:hypothetical protein
MLAQAGAWKITPRRYYDQPGRKKILPKLVKEWESMVVMMQRILDL